MRLACLCVALAFGCGSKAGGGGDDSPPGDGGLPDSGDPCLTDPANCPTDEGLFVSAARGSDGNPGSKAMPLQTIGAAIAKAKAKGGVQSVFVAGGMYPEKVTLAGKVSVNGGYECDASACTWTRDLMAFESTIVNQDFEGVLAGAGVGLDTLLGGFTIRGRDGTPPAAPGSVGVTIAGGAPTVRGNKIFAGNVTANGGATGADRSIGIAMRTTDNNLATIENNEITSGMGGGLSAGITMEAGGGLLSYALITANVIKSGPARRSVGIAVFGSGPTTVITNNDITAGSSLGGASHGIEITSSASITNNRINTDAGSTGTCAQATQWCAGIATNGATNTNIHNNVVFGPKGSRTAGVFMTETESPTGVVLVNGNYLNGGGQGGQPSGTSRNTSAAIVVSIGSCNSCGLEAAVGRVRNNILDGGINLDRFGVREDPAQGRTTSVEVLDSNDIWFQPNLPGRSDTLYRQVTSSGVPIDTKSIFLLDGWTSPPTMDNQNEDPVIDGTWHLHSNSPCIDTGTPTEAPQKDFDGDSRPKGSGFDIGPDEAQ